MTGARRAIALAPLLAGAAPAEGAEAAGGDVGAVVLGVLFVGAAYLLADIVVDRLQRRFLVMAGAEYLLLGVLLGPLVLARSATLDVGALLPFAALAAGWFGLLRGLGTELRRLEESRTGALRIATVEAVVVGGAVGAFAWAALRPAVLGGEVREAAAAAATLGACAVAASTQPLALLRQRYAVGRALEPVVRRVTELSEVFAILASGLIVCVLHPGAGALSPTEWAVVTAALGVVLGLLFGPFVGERQSENRRFLALVGIITLASGAALFLRLSPLLVNLVLGLVLGLRGRGRDALRATLERTEGPMNLVLLVFAGALWRPPSLPGVGPASVVALALAAVAGFVLLRWLGKLVGDRLATAGTAFRRDLHRGQLGHGSFTIAIAVLLRAYYEGPAVDWAYTVVLGSFVVYSPLSPRALRALLVDAGDIERDARPRSERPGPQPT